jgi:acyl-CoA synthetase (AMP-forming)/AMP-acid ligase II
MPHEMGYDLETIEREDGVVRHSPDAFPDLETTTINGKSVRAYADRPKTVDGMLRDARERGPDRDALFVADTGTRLTYRQLDERVDAVATGLLKKGIEPGDVVVLFLPNDVTFVESFFACQRIGAVATPTNTRLSARELDYVISDVDPTALLIDDSFLDTYRQGDRAIATDRVFVSGNGSTFASYESLQSAGTVDSDPPAEADTACLLYTSGTTGDPKGCPASHFNLVNGALNYVRSFDTHDGLTTGIVVPLFHSTGLVSCLLHTVANAGKAVVLDDYDPKRFLKLVERERIKYVIAVPTIYILAMERADPSAHDLSSWTIGAYGGAPMPGDVVPRLREAFPELALIDAYGTTEAIAGMVTGCPDRHTDEHANSIGLPTPPTELKIVDEDGETLPPGEIGEFAFRGPYVVDRYLDKPAETAESFRDDWFYTGDLALITEEGFVVLKGREKDKILRGGENVYPLEIESELINHDDVLEAAVTGFPDAVLGERILAVVTPKDSATLTEDDLREHCKQGLAEYKIPDIIRILSELPRNASGKVVSEKLVPEPLQHGIQVGEQ